MSNLLIFQISSPQHSKNCSIQHLKILISKYLNVEPLLIRQCSIIFTAGNSFIKGMTSDNENKEEIKKELIELKQDICNELKE